MTQTSHLIPGMVTRPMASHNPLMVSRRKAIHLPVHRIHHLSHQHSMYNHMQAHPRHTPRSRTSQGTGHQAPIHLTQEPVYR